MSPWHALALLAVLPLTVAAEEPPVVAVVFSVESTDFKSILEKERLQQIEETIAMHARERFPYVAWAVAGTEKVAAASLIVTLVDDPKSPDGNDNYLQYEVMLGSAKEALAFVSEPLYRWYDFKKPRRKPKELQDAVCARIACDFATRDLAPTLQANLLQFIPLPTARPWPTTAQRIVVPLSWRRVAADRGSIIEVAFKSQWANAAVKRGHAEVTYLDERAEAPGAGVIEGMLQRYVRGPVVTEKLGQWPPEIDSVFAAEALRDWTVYMRVYKKRSFLDTSNGRVMQPGVQNVHDRSAAVPAKRAACLCSTSR